MAQWCSPREVQGSNPRLATNPDGSRKCIFQKRSKRPHTGGKYRSRCVIAEWWSLSLTHQKHNPGSGRQKGRSTNYPGKASISRRLRCSQQDDQNLPMYSTHGVNGHVTHVTRYESGGFFEVYDHITFLYKCVSNGKILIKYIFMCSSDKYEMD